MMYKAAINIFAQVSFYTKFLFLLGKCLVGFLSHRVSLSLQKIENLPILHSSVCGFGCSMWLFTFGIVLFDVCFFV